MILKARSCPVLFAAVLVTLGAVRPAASDDLGSSAAPAALPPSQWTVTITPYGWVTWLKGDQTVKGRMVELDVDPITLIEHLESVPFMGYAEVRKGPFAFYGDIVYADLGLSASGVRSRGVHPAIPGTLTASLGLDYEQTIVEVGGAYEIVRGRTAIDVLAGARYWRQEADVQFALGLDISDLDVSSGRAIARSGPVDWVDPVIGVRVRHELAPGQSLMLRADIGGFDLGSQFSWNVLATYSWEIAVRDGLTYSGIVGYRALDVDYEQGSGRTKYEYDVLQHGPVTGFTIAF